MYNSLSHLLEIVINVKLTQWMLGCNHRSALLLDSFRLINGTFLVFTLLLTEALITFIVFVK